MSPDLDGLWTRKANVSPVSSPAMTLSTFIVTAQFRSVRSLV
jgi:hypothetical protein